MFSEWRKEWLVFRKRALESGRRHYRMGGAPMGLPTYQEAEAAGNQSRPANPIERHSEAVHDSWTAPNCGALVRAGVVNRATAARGRVHCGRRDGRPVPQVGPLMNQPTQRQ